MVEKSGLEPIQADFQKWLDIGTFRITKPFSSSYSRLFDIVYVGLQTLMT